MRFRALFFAVLISAFTFSSAIYAQTISGSVRDTGGNPLGGAVRLHDGAGNFVENFWIDPQGNFQTWSLANGTYHAVTTFTDEMLDEAWDNIPCENLICTIPGTTSIVVTGSDVTGIDFVLEPIAVGGHISGVVEDGSNTPLPDVGIDIRNANGEYLFGIGTGPDGTFQTSLLANDTYYAHTVNEPLGLGRELYDNYPCLPADICGDPGFVITNGTAVVVSGADEGDIDFKLEVPAGAIISGQLTDADSSIVLPDVHMNLLDEFNQYMANTNTDPLGNYYFSGLADGTYKVYAVGVPEGYTGELFGGDHCPDWSCNLNVSGTPIIISSGASAPGKDIVLDYTGTRLLGTVTRSDSGAPVSSQYAHMGIDLFNAAGEYIGGWPTNRAGQYQITLPGAGNYYLLAINDWDVHGLINEAWDNIKCQYDCDPIGLGATLIAVADGTTVVADFVLDPGFNLSGAISIEGTPTGDGFVNIWDDGGYLVFSAGNDGGGNWMTDQLTSGTYFATVRGEDFGMVSQLFNGISCPQEFCDVTTGTPIVVTDSDITGINFDLVPFSADWIISGSVFDGDDNPLGGDVRFFDPFGNHVFDTGIDHLGNFQSQPVTNGTYFALTVNTYEVLDEAWDNIPCENLICDIPGSTPITVNEGDITGIDFVLEPILAGGRISGHVKDGSAVPVANVGLAVKNSDGLHLFDSDTDSNGYYQTALLANDSYYIHTVNEPFGLGRELYNDYPCLPANLCDDQVFVTTNGTAVVVAGTDKPDIDFELEVPAGAIISGQLTDADTGIVLPDVHMNLLDEFNQYIAHTNTDPLGDYYFSGLADGTYKVYAVGVPEGYTGELYGGDHCPDWSCDLNVSGTPIIVGGGVSVPDRNIELDYAGTRLLGTITRSDSGDPVSSHFGGVGIDLFNTAGEHIAGSPTNQAGQYQITLPGAGSYYLLAWNDWSFHGLINEAWDDIKCQYDCDPIGLGATLIPVAEGTTVVANFVLDPGFNLSGTIRFDGTLTGDGNVNIWDQSGQVVHPAGNDGSGNWMSNQLVAGTYFATARGEAFGMVSQLFDSISCPQEFCDVTGGTPIVVSDSHVTGINFDLEPASADWTISGFVRDHGGNPLGGAVRFLDPLGNRLFEVGIDEAGNFQSDPVADGTYFVITRSAGAFLDEAWDNIPCENRVCDVTGSTPIVVSGSDVTGIDFVLEPITVGGYIKGSIEDSTHTPLDNVSVIIRNANGGWLYRVGTGPDGAYQSPLLANETYFLHTRDEPFGLGQEMYDDIPCQPHGGCGNAAYIAATATPVVIAGADETGIDFSLDLPAGGLITGKVTDFDTGIPLPDVHVLVLDAFHNQIDATNTDALGDYYFSALEDGDYKVYADGIPEGYTAELYGGDHCPDWTCDLDIAGTPISISGGALADGKNIVLDYDGTRLLGTVTRSDSGAPVSSQYARAEVDLFNSIGEYLGTWATNRAGQYQITLPGAGDYYLAVTVDWNFHQLINELWNDFKCYDNCDPIGKDATLIAVATDTTVVADFVLDPEVVFNHGFEK